MDLKEIATRTSGFAGADLANIVIEPAFLAARNLSSTVDEEDIDEGNELEVVVLEQKNTARSEKEKKIDA